MGKGYEVQILRAAQKELNALQPLIRLQILNKLKGLELDPLPKGKNEIKILHGFRPPLLRLRSGDFRIVYRISGRTVEVLSVIPRKELERRLRKL